MFDEGDVDGEIYLIVGYACLHPTIKRARLPPPFSRTNEQFLLV